MNRLKYPQAILALLLALLLLAGCGTAVPAESTSAPEVTAAPEAAAPGAPSHRDGAVVVKDVDALLGALADDTTIEIDAAQLRLDAAADYGFGYSDGPYTWESMGQGEYELVLRDLHGLTIRSLCADGTKLTTGALFADVLSCRNCKALTLEGLTLGHRGELRGFCEGNVVDLQRCEGALLSGCDLFGCGVIAVNAYECVAPRLEGCTLRDCKMAALNVTRCVDFQARDCAILRCGEESSLAALCVASCEGFAMINCTVRDGENAFLLDAMNSSSVCLLGGEATGNRFSNALFQLYDRNVTLSGCALSDNDFGACYLGGAQVAVTGAGKELLTFRDFAEIARKDYEGDYVGPAPMPAPGPADIPAPGETREVHVTTVDEFLAAVAPRTTVYLDGEAFDLSTASNYGSLGGTYYKWEDTYDGPELVLRDLEDFALIGRGMGATLLSAVPRYADVLSFENCRRVAIADMTLGHTVEPGFCSGDVLDISWSEGVTVERCGFFGCGEIGITASCASKIRVNDSNIYDCSYLGAFLDRVSDILFYGCSITNCGDGGYGINGIRLTECSGVFYDDQRVFDGDFVPRAVG